MQDLIGFILPIVIDYINKFPAFSDSRVRYVVSMVVCLLVGALFHLNELKAGSVTETLSSAGIIFAEAQTVYKLYWKESGARARLIGE
jgi:hypothetical protein